jgi:hypothetical protein
MRKGKHSEAQIIAEHADYFTKNLVAIRCEERVTLAVYQPFAFVKGSFPAGMGT